MPIIKFTTTSNTDNFEAKVLEEIKTNLQYIKNISKRHNALCQAYNNGIVNLETLNGELKILRAIIFGYDEALEVCSANIEHYLQHTTSEKDDK